MVETRGLAPLLTMRRHAELILILRSDPQDRVSKDEAAGVQ